RTSCVIEPASSPGEVTRVMRASSACAASVGRSRERWLRAAARDCRSTPALRYRPELARKMRGQVTLRAVARRMVAVDAERPAHGMRQSRTGGNVPHVARGHVCRLTPGPDTPGPTRAILAWHRSCSSRSTTVTTLARRRSAPDGPGCLLVLALALPAL